jgi:nucleoid DNA-binding protein
MKYPDFLAQVAEKTGHPVDVVKEILFTLPVVLIDLEDKETVRTPLGSFRMARRTARQVKAPKTGKLVDVIGGTVVKLRPGKRLRRDDK